ncbi:MAG TPA: BTAD domain-containing putative transcriptional regulator [Gaiellaceae bacterium]|nr:BTAD domain-containing putative transcriptional regulator [Gaiellaceae bacterium]
MEARGSSSSAGAAPAPLELRILGPLEVRNGREPLTLGGGRPRALLALLLVHRGVPVSTDRIVDELWGESPPRSARHMVEVYVSSLRKGLGKDRILRAASGYRIRLEPEELDAVRFERLAAEGGEALAAGEAERSSARLAEALELWRGPALADFAYEPFAGVEARRLEELRLHAEEEWVDAQLALGNAAGLVARLEENVARAPLRERRQGQLMLALAAAGRQADALAAYKSARRLLVSELGLEPSAELRRIERAILTQADGGPAEGETAPEPEERATRRVVTVLSADLADGGHGADPEVARAEAARALDPARRALEAHGGTVRELSDGTLMALFGIPVVHEDDALRALRAAVEVRHAGLVARVGVDTGLALAAGEGASGDVVRTAAQLRDAASPGEVVVGEQTRILAGGQARLEPRWDERLAAWRLVDVPAAGARVRAWPPLVGRNAELARLLEAFERAVDSERVQRVTVVGDAGIGKSRLGQELADRVRDRADVLVGRCLAYGEAITWWPLRSVVREAGGVSFEAIRKLLGDAPNAEAIARRVAGTVGLLDTVHPIEEVRWAVRRLLETLAARRPLVIGFDDLYWAEPAFLDLVDHLTEVMQARILLVCMTRAELLEERPGWARPRPSAEVLMLGALSRDESSQLLDGLDHSGPVLEPADRRRIVAAAEGNPLFLEQLAAFAAERQATDGDSSLPTSLRTLLAARLDRLSSGERAVVECAAVAGRTFWLDAVRELLPAGSVSGLGRSLDSLVRRDLLEPRRTSVPFMRAFRFRHSLIQDVAYHSVPKQRRAEAHERMAGWIEHAPRAAVGWKDRRIGHHLELASRYRAELGPDDPESAALAARAAGFLALAASRASTRGNPRAAAALLRRACGLLPRSDPQRRVLLPQLGVELSEAGDPAAAEAALAEAIDDAVAASDRRTELRARLELAAIHGFTAPRTAAVEIVAIAEEAIPLFERAGDHASLARVWHVLGYVDVWGVRWDAGAISFERALEHARTAGDAREEASLVRWLARSLLFGSTPAPDGIERCEGLLEGLHGRRDAEAGVLEAMASLQAMCGRFDDARELYLRGGRTYAELGQNGRLARLTAVGTRIELLAGDRSAAERELRAAYELYEGRGERASLAAVAASLARLTSEEGRDEEAEELAHVAEESAAAGDVTTQVRRRVALARVRSHRGELGEAEALAREAVTLTEGTQFPDWRADTLLDLADVLRAAGREEEANAAARDALRLYEAKGNLASAERVRAVLG